ncbi:MAG: alpha/beta fold hydrolase [Actinomycetota bacterium]|jgi:triacylglycerol esterase/lipase EstA (alpha/beta hydrolase family)|nr:alpha/beta fold hydrolase [Actinomycetota bacterium]
MRTRPGPVAVALATLAALFVTASPTPAAAAPADPVIVVAGTFSPAFANEPLAQRLRSDGYRVYIFELPTLGTQDINASARSLNTYADSVRSQTGAAKVDLVGHSQGGLVARSYVKSFGGVGEVDSLITLGTPNRGTYVANLVSFLGFGNCLAVTACRQMAIGSDYLAALNAGDDTIGAVRYTTFRTAQDELVRPVDNATLFDGAVNVRIQDQCWARLVGHVGLILDGTVYSGIRQALGGSTAIRLNCWAL